MRHGIATTSTTLACVAAALALACSSPATPERRYYLLRVDVDAPVPPAQPGQSAGIAKVEIPPYLDRAGLVLETGTHVIREARYHLWAEPLQQGIRYYLEGRLAADLGYEIGGGRSASRSWSRRIEIDVRQFHGDEDGKVRLVAAVSVTATDGALLAAETFASSTSQQGDGYEALVAAQIALLDELAGAIEPMLR